MDAKTGGKQGEAQITELLALADAPDNLEARELLQLAMNHASFALSYGHRPPQQAYRRLAMAAWEMRAAIRELLGYKFKMHEDWREITVYLPPLLQQVEEQARFYSQSKPRRGQPAKEDKSIIVWLALDFYREHGSRKPSANPTNPFPKFAECFYRAVKGKEVEGSLDYYIRRAINRSKRPIKRSDESSNVLVAYYRSIKTAQASRKEINPEKRSAKRLDEL